MSDATDLLAIDLSSERVRLAMWLLEGVRQGQPLGALLGYRFERRLQEVGQAKFISVFRELAPLVARKLELTPNPRPIRRIHRRKQCSGWPGTAATLAERKDHRRNGQELFLLVNRSIKTRLRSLQPISAMPSTKRFVTNSCFWKKP